MTTDANDDRMMDGVPPWLFWSAVVAVFAVALVLRMPTFTLPWTGVHNAWGGAFYSIVARNLLRYGAEVTAFAPITNSGVVDPSQFEIYYHHPPLSIWLTALSFRAFGVHEWSARLVPLIFSLLTLALVFEIARDAFGRATALVALYLMAIVPADAYYATHLDPNNSTSIFFTVLAVEAYRRWYRSGHNGAYAVLLFAIVLGCWSGWFTYLVIPGIVAHGLLVGSRDGRSNWRLRLAVLPALAVGMFALFFLHRYISLAGGRHEVYDAISARFLKRTVELQMSRLAIYKIYAYNMWNLYTTPILILGSAWMVLFVHDLWNARVRIEQWCIVILLSYGFLYAIAFPGHLPSHDFFVRTYSPALALAGAVVLVRGIGALKTLRVRQASAIVILGALGAIASLRTHRRFGSDDGGNGVTLKRLGEQVAAVSTLDVPVFFPDGEDRIMQYYVDRPSTFGLDSPEKLAAAAAGVNGRYLILFPERNVSKFPSLLEHLRRTFPERHGDGNYIFEGSHPR